MKNNYNGEPTDEKKEDKEWDVLKHNYSDKPLLRYG